MKRKWTFELIHKEALKFKTRCDFKRGNCSAYQAAQKLKILDEVCSHMPKMSMRKGVDHHAFKWTPNSLHKKAKMYTTRSSFHKGSSGAYDAARDLGILDQICAHMPKRVDLSGENNPSYRRTKEDVIHKSLEFKTKAQFHKKASGYYKAAKRMGILHELFPEDGRVAYPARLIWTEKTLPSEALLYNERIAFAKGSPGAYDAALTLGIMDDLCTHMRKSRNSSRPEIELLNILKEFFPNLIKKTFKVNVLNKPLIKRFQVDILNSDTLLGIEYDGERHHSEEFLIEAKTAIGWTVEDAKNYHSIKDDALWKCHGVRILHVKGEDWNRNKQECVNRCLQFLNCKSQSESTYGE
jgi:very-short-patch-repair endonuclease